MKLYAREGSFRAQKVLVAAQHAGTKVEVVTVASEKEINGKGLVPRIPLLETPSGNISTSNAMMRFVADGKESLVGNDAYERAQIDSWIDFSVNELETPATMWTYPIIGFAENVPAVSEQAAKDLRAALSSLEDYLKNETFLVGRGVTLADIACASTLILPMKLVLDDKERKKLPSVTRWFLTCVNQPEFLKVVGPVTLIKKAVKPKAPVKQAAAATSSAPAATAAEEPQKPAEPESAIKNLANLPKSGFVMDSWKRQYSNAPDGDYYKAMPWFWENLDREGYSIYFSDYNYNDELKIGFQVSNLVGGFVQRCDEIRKHAFGVVQILGQDGGPMEIKGCWLFRGPNEKIILECNPDAEYHTWTKVIDLNEENKKKIEELWCAESEVQSKPIFDCKVFK